MKPTILLVDDDDAFKMLIERAIQKSGLNVSLQYVGDGEEAILYLSHQGQFSDETAFPFPSLVLLDLKMPRMNGFEVLQWKLEQPQLNGTPFIVLSSSDFEKDKQRVSGLGARGFLTKPMGLLGLTELVESLDEFLANDAS